ncbi:MAG TPA: Smr/MutS family protein [Saprospiraceae bacterium]|nr:Smr/MutS family protein [Saprospiraceae bacterium]HMP25215.1 Smr/MutS family protein [Saprospiraceae bacterium]
MLLEPKDLYERLEFDKVLELLEQECLGELGRAAVQAIQPDKRRGSIEQRLLEVHDFKRTLDKGDIFPITQYFDIAEDLYYLRIEDYVLGEESFKRLAIVLRFVRDIFWYFNPTRREVYPHLYHIIQPVVFEDFLIKAIEKVIDEQGNIRPDASPELLRIRKQIQEKQKELDKRFRILINEFKTKGWVTDSVESVRNGRRVLTVPSEHKRKVRGIIHDESTTGKTAFIEPEGIIEVNNDIFDLETEERREIYRILKELSATVRPFADPIQTYMDLLVRFDLIRAKAKIAQRMDARMPQLSDKPNFGFKTAYHPLLLLKNKQLDRKTVPFDLVLMGNNRILMLSGPNAGGKSITLKSVGLLQLMVQSGMLVPVDELSEFGIFHNIFADIGDQQSLEDDLSTYSSHLSNMRRFVENADNKTLILFDEFGAGTDPKMGGAIAEAILNELNRKNVFGVITTHYSNLKIYAFKTKGLVNGSMWFDKDNLSPTYEFKVGRPGSSYAFEIAQKTGLQKKILEYARHRTGKNEQAVDQLLIDLQREKQELEDKLARLSEREQQLEKLIKNYDQLHRDLEFRRKKLKLELKEKELQQIAQENKELERLMREIKEEKNLEKAKELAAKVREERKQKAEEVATIVEEVYHEPAKVGKKDPIKEGDFVRLITGSATGRVEAVDKKQAVVLIGDMRMTVKLRDLEQAKEPLDVNAARSVQTDVSYASAFQPRLDIRGLRPEEALKVLEDFFDQALMTNSNHLRILHGKGSGVLRNTVRTKLREYNVPMHISHPHPEFGGDGITLVEFK